ncbi:hypothetical protein ACXZEU_001884 [Escherichia coli]
MFDLVQVDSEWRIRSDELLELINQIRKAEGLNELKNDRFNAKIRDELEGEFLEAHKMRVQADGKAANFRKEKEVYSLTGNQALRMGMRETKRIRAKVVERIQQLRLEVSQLKLIQQCGQMADRALELANDGKLKDAADLIVLAERQYKPISSQAGANLNSCKPSKRKLKALVNTLAVCFKSTCSLSDSSPGPAPGFLLYRTITPTGYTAGYNPTNTTPARTTPDKSRIQEGNASDFTVTGTTDPPKRGVPMSI